MSGGNYIRGERGMSLIAKSMEQLELYSCLQSSDGEVFSELFDKTDELAIMMCDPSKKQMNITSQLSKCMSILDKFEKAFNTFKTSGSAESSLFAYWNNFLSNMAPVLLDLTRSFPDADWYLYLSSVSRAIDLCFLLIASLISAGCRSTMRTVLHCASVFLKFTNLSYMEILLQDTLPEKPVLFQWIRLWKKLIANQRNHLLVLLALPEKRRLLTRT